MKVFCLLFAFYTLAISIAPCSDVHGRTDEAVTTLSQAQEHHDEHNDICSPFCSCSCCQSVTVMAFYTHELTTTTIAVNQPFIFEEDFHSSDCASIWQPPKIS